MAVTSAQVTVSSTAVALNTEAGSTSGTRLVVKNSHATDAVALGASGVTAGTGFQLAAGATVTLELGHGEQVYGIRVTANDIVVHVLRNGD